MTHILIPREPSPALLRPFVGCPQEELPQAYAAMIRIAEVERARAGSQCLAQIEEPAGAAPAAVAPLPAVFEQIAQSWDGCMYDAPGETLDIGADIRAAAKRLLAEHPAAVAPQGDEDDSLLLCASDLQHSAIYDSHSEMQDCARSVADRIKALAARALAAPALEAPPAVTGRTAPRNDDERAAAQFFADNPGAALLAWPLYLARDKSLALEAPAAPGVPAGFALVPIEPTQQMLDAGRWSGAGSVSIQEEWARKEVWSRMLATVAPPPAAYADDLVALVVNLVQALSAAAPDNDLASHALDYLKRNGLQGSPLQAAEAAPQAPAAPVLVGDGQADAYLADPGRLETLARSHPAGLVRALARAAMAAPAAPAEGEVLVEVIGLTGSGKSAICGEIEILCRALGLDVSWPDGDPEKNMTHAEWTAAIEAYKPRVRIVERNVPRQSNGGPAK